LPVSGGALSGNLLLEDLSQLQFAFTDGAFISSDGSDGIQFVDNDGNTMIWNGSHGLGLNVGNMAITASEVISNRFVSPVVGLTFNSTQTTDASTGQIFSFTATNNFTLANPSNASDGQVIRWLITQDGMGSRLITLGSDFLLGTDLTSVVLSTAPGLTDLLTVLYINSVGKYLVTGFVRGFTL
jgi:hypothetical protein